MTKNKLNTIYIISKGRPHCITAQALTDMDYTGDWYIVCGNNDETLSQYKDKWGEDRIIVFDWFAEVKNSDLLDNFGVEKKGSGAVPVRNATQKISKAKGELRHWQFDDDYQRFYIINNTGKKWVRLSGKRFEKELLKLAKYAHKSNLANIGFALGAETRQENAKLVGHRVFNAHNLSNDDNLFTIWRSRMNDDLINAIETYRNNKYELHVKYMQIIMVPTQSEKGGNTDIYEQDGTVRKTAYAILIDPLNVKLTTRYGRYHHKVNWVNIIPKLINEKYKL